MKKFFLYFIGFVIIFFIAPAICTATPKKSKETVAQEEIQESQQENQNLVNEQTDFTEQKNTEQANQEGKNQDITIKLLHSATGEVEELSLNQYLYGVVSSEMPASYEIEALKAQAIVARTYTIYQIKHNSNKHENADICDNYACCQAWISKMECRRSGEQLE